MDNRIKRSGFLGFIRLVDKGAHRVSRVNQLAEGIH